MYTARALTFAFLLVAAPVYAAIFELTQTFSRPEGFEVTSTGFGASLAFIGDDILIGDVGVGQFGESVLHLFDGDRGAYLRSFEAPEAGLGGFGLPVASVNRDVLAGAKKQREPTGQGVVYRVDVDTGAVVARLDAPTSGRNNSFTSISPVGELIAIGSWQDDTRGDNAGAVFLFDAATNDLIDTLFSPVPSQFDNYAIRTAAIGTDLAVSAPQANSSGVASGDVYLYDTDPASPTFGELLHTFTDPNPIFADHFGQAISGSGDNLLIGSSGNAGVHGATYLFDADLDSPTFGNLLDTFLHPLGLVDGSSSAAPVSFVGDDILMGSPLVRGSSDGAFLFDGVPSSPTFGELLQVFNEPLPTEDSWFGGVVLGEDDRLLISARSGDRVYLYERRSVSVPEPSTLLLMGIGLAGIGFAGRRKLAA